MKRFIAMAAAGVIMAVGLSACGNYTEPYKDAERGGQDSTPADILLMPNGFSNIATKCDGHGHRVYSVYHNDNYGSVAVVPDPAC